MPWARFRFKGEPVWVRVSADGQPVADRDGRAEMKYRAEDEKSYRPARANLVPIPADAPEAQAAGPRDAPPQEENTAGAIMVWTDGACSGNPGPMGIGMVVIDGAVRRERGEFLGIGT